MKKGCIITLNGNNNLGNRLQNYAMQKYLENNNIKCDTLWCNNKDNCIKKILEYIKIIVLVISAPLYKKNKERLLNKKRIKKIAEFTNMYINKRNISKRELDKIENDYDIFIFGSDQVWHPYAIKNDNLVCGEYIKQKKKISYAASLAVNELDKVSCEKLRKCLETFDKITVREDKGKEILESILPDKNIEVVIDPTMLLSTNEWDKIAKKPKNLKSKKFILTYFLGKISNEREKEIRRISRENNCEIINILDKESGFYMVDPAEFVYLEKKAFLVCTDSYHSCVFAILFNKPFLVFNREDNSKDMSSRMNTLLKKFKLEERWIANNIINENKLMCDYTEANKILKKEREKSEKIINEGIN